MMFIGNFLLVDITRRVSLPPRGWSPPYRLVRNPQYSSHRVFGTWGPSGVECPSLAIRFDLRPDSRTLPQSEGANPVRHLMKGKYGSHIPTPVSRCQLRIEAPYADCYFCDGGQKQSQETIAYPGEL